MLVPLLLHLLSSDLLRDERQLNYFVFAGFCFLTGYFSERFINTMAGRVLENLVSKVDKQEEKIEQVSETISENAEKLDVVISGETELNDSEDKIEIKLDNIVINDPNIQNGDNLINNVENVLLSLSGGFKFKSISAIAKKNGMSIETAQSFIAELLKQKLVTRITQGHILYWTLTTLGRQAVKDIKLKKT